MRHVVANLRALWKPLLIGGAAVFLFAGVLAKLLVDWWSDENYSHGLLVPAVIAYIIWQDRRRLQRAVSAPRPVLGSFIVIGAMTALVAGTLGAELFTQRISLVVFLIGIATYFFGTRLLANLAAPFGLLAFAIPIPEILFNKIAFPLQLFASRIAYHGIQLVGVPSLRKGNVIEVLPIGQAQTVLLEVVEACSGIRSLMTLASLAVILVYLTRSRRKSVFPNLRALVQSPDFLRAVFLVACAVPIALLANAARVFATAILAYLYGAGVTEGLWHDASGFLVFVVAFVLMLAVNQVLLGVLNRSSRLSADAGNEDVSDPGPVPERLVLLMFIATLSSAVLINWIAQRGEVLPARRELTKFPILLGTATKFGDDLRFSAATEEVLKASDYMMRDYRTESGRIVNLYVGYYSSQRTGSTYHSPQNCLPGSGWDIASEAPISITTPSGRTFLANRYSIRSGTYSGMMIYWFQGRGRINASEYWDKAGTIVDSLKSGRSDGAIIRLMVPAEQGDPRALAEAVGIAGLVADRLEPYIPN